MFNKISLKKAWTVIILFIGVVPTIIITLLFGERLYTIKLKQALQLEQHTNELAKQRIDAELTLLKKVLINKTDPINHLLSNLDSPDNKSQFTNLLKLIPEREPVFHEVMVVSLEGDIIDIIEPDNHAVDNDPDSKQLKDVAKTIWQSDKDRTDYPELIIPSMNREYVGQPTHHHGMKILSIAEPIGYPVKAVLIGLVNIDKLWKKSIVGYYSQEGSKSHGYLVDSRGSLINKVRASNLELDTLMTHLNIVRSGIIGKPWNERTPYMGVNGEMVFGTSTHVDSLNWVLISEVPKDVILQPIKMLLIKICVFTLLGLSIFIWIAIYLSKKTINPIQQACHAIDDVAKGDYEHKLALTHIIELDSLVNNFNAMLNARSLAEAELLNSQKELAQSEAKFRGMMQSSLDGILFVNKNKKILLINPAIENITGYKITELQNHSINILIAKEYREQYTRNFDQFLKDSLTKSSFLKRELKLQHKDGHLVPIDIQLTLVKTDHEVFVAVMIKDISAQKEAEKKIIHQAHFDNLTDLPNRFLTQDRLNRLLKSALRNKTKVAVLFIDLDDFKTVNDSLGHEIGDKLLVEAGQRLQKGVREGDTVGRQGGDEFIILLSDLNTAKDASIISENLVKLFGKPFLINEKELNVTLSIGIAIFPNDGNNPSLLLRNSDSAMYHSKNNGRNQFNFFTQHMNEKISYKIKLEEQMLGALERGEFEVYYQAKIDFSTQQLIGAEALLRWNNPILGSVPPSEFIPVAEHSKFINVLGKFVLQQALTQAALWLKHINHEFMIAVNISPHQFRDAMLIEYIEQLLEQCEISPDHLEIELTENGLMGNKHDIAEKLIKCHQLGITIAMDDFGTGYSSLNYLRNFPFDIMKIDRSFISKITSNSTELKLITASIAMAHGLNLKVVAEGIETIEQYQLLKQLNCDYGQGYYFSSPMSAEKFTQCFVH